MSDKNNQPLQEREVDDAPQVNRPWWVSIIVATICIALTQGFAVAAAGKEDPFIHVLTTAQVVSFICVAIQWIAYIPAVIFRSEKWFDLTGSITYIVCTGYALYSSQIHGVAGGLSSATKHFVVAGMVAFWGLRLGTFLFLRVLADGKDKRFTEIKKDAFRWFSVWNIQAAWVYLTAMPVFAFMTSPTPDNNFGPQFIVGASIWAIGMGIEIIADSQKSWWREQPENKGRYIEYGLWYYSRHPNYFGEWLLWVGMFVICCEGFVNWQWVMLFSPLWVWLQLNKISGINLQEERADKKWGHLAEYRLYKARTSTFFLMPKGSAEADDSYVTMD